MKAGVLSLGSLLIFTAAARANLRTAVVAAPVADIRREPVLPQPNQSDDLEETQVLFGETVDVAASSGTWSLVNVPDQPEFSHHQKWEGYPGWVLTSALRTDPDFFQPNAVVIQKWLPVTRKPKASLWMQLPFGARVFVFKTDGPWSLIDLGGEQGWVASRGLRPLSRFPKGMALRKAVLATAEQLLGDPYVWGGRSPHDSLDAVRLSGVDCSGLVHLSYQVNGVLIPRDALEQYMRAEKISRNDLRPADLIFSAPLNHPDHIIHVLLYAGNGYIVEAPQTGLPVRKITFEQKFGKPLVSVESGDRLPDRIIYFGRLLP